MPWATLCELEELQEDVGKYVEIDALQLAVFLHDGEVHVLDNLCPHAGGSLASGYIADGCVVCPLHDWPFRLADGQMPDSYGVGVKKFTSRLHDLPDGRRLVQVELPRR
ncbi:MAG: Rieske (2Fe-2S) protein [Phycisphaerae bacterium]